MTAGLIIRVVHILFGVFWAGAAIMLAAFIEPTIAALGPAGGKFLQRMVGPGKFGPSMSAAAMLTVLSGAAMLWLGGNISTWVSSGYGLSIIVGSCAGFISLASGLAINAPTAGRLSTLSREIEESGKPPLPEQIAEMTKLRARLHRAGLLSASVLTISVIAMAAARYL